MESKNKNINTTNNSNTITSTNNSDNNNNNKTNNNNIENNTNTINYINNHINDNEINEVDEEKAVEGGFLAGLSRNATRILGSFSKASLQRLSKPLAGTISGMAEESAGYPLDLIKTRIQLGKGGVGSANTSIIKIFKDVIKTEGAIGLFKGLSSPLISSALVTAVQFGLFEDTLKYLRKHQYFKSHDTFSLLLSGSIAGFAQSFITCPVDLIKIQMQIQGISPQNSININQNNNNNKNNSSNNNNNKNININNNNNNNINNKPKGNSYFTKLIYKERGILGFYQGLSPTLFRDVPGLAIFFTTYETLKKQFGIPVLSTKSPTEFIKSFIPIVLSGGSAGVLYHGLTHPFDIAKTIIQSDRSGTKYKGTFDCLKQVYQNQGPKSLFKGFSAVAIKSFQSNAVGFLVYEMVINM
ncbi:hypothetical protein ACTFIU_010896 [Dictyostelium citrinum]